MDSDVAISGDVCSTEILLLNCFSKTVFYNPPREDTEQYLLGQENM